MSLQVKTVTAVSLTGLELLVWGLVVDGWHPIDNPGQLLHDGKPRNGEQWVQHLQRRA